MRAMRDEALFEAIEFATRAHRGQFRKGTRLPYILHPLRVGQILIEAPADVEVVVAGILHDTLEDTHTTRQDLASRFGERVSRIVESVSEPDKSLPWQARKEHTIAALALADADALLVACADKLDNIRSMGRGERRDGPEFWRRFREPRERQAWYYREIARVLLARADEEPLRALSARLAVAVDGLFCPAPEAR